MATISVSDSIQAYENVMFSKYDQHYNDAYSTIATAPSPASSGTQLTLATGDGVNFPPGTYNAVVWPIAAQPSNSNSEIVRVTGKSGDILQITRTQENTVARSILVGDQIAAGITAKTFTDIEGFAPQTGAVVQRVSTNVIAAGTTTTILPFDDTIPQITEGSEFFTQAITPKSTTNKLLIQVVIMVSPATSDFVSAALFQDATSNALAANAAFISTNTGSAVIALTHEMAAGTISSTTFRVRAGANGANTVTVDGQSSGRRFGGITVSNITITEVSA